MKQISLAISIMLLCIGSFFSQNTIQVRKSKGTLVGRELSFVDLRGVPSGSITFLSEDSCQVDFEMTISKSKIADYFLKRININTKHFANYYTLTDTSLVFYTDNFVDTCFFNLNQKKLSFNRLLYGEIKEKDYAIFYYFNQMIYSESAKKVFNTQAFADTVDFIGKFDSIQDVRERRKQIKKFKNALKEFNENLTITDYSGSYALNQNKVTLLNAQNKDFASLILQKDSTSYKLYSTNNFFLSGQINSRDKRGYVGDLIVEGDSASIDFAALLPKNIIEKLPSEAKTKVNYDVFHHSLLKLVLTNTLGDTITLTKDPLVNRQYLGGVYPSVYESLNGNTKSGENFYFLQKQAFKYDQTKKAMVEGFDYLIKDQNLILKGENNTLVDELNPNKTTYLNITQKNGSPLFWGLYRYRDYDKDENTYLLFFSNNTGAKVITSKNELKNMRKYLDDELIPELVDTTSSITFFDFDVNKEEVILRLDSGKEETYQFYNLWKGLKQEDIRFIYDK